MSTLRERVVAKAESQLGVRYFTMHAGPKGSANPGWGCAMLAMWCHNQVLGTDYYGSCYNIWGDAIGATIYTQGGGEFEVVPSLAQARPGDVICYFKGADTSRSTLCGHVALYVGDGMVIGAWGYGTPGTSYYMAGGSVRKTSVAGQMIGAAYRIVRCKRLDREPAPVKPAPRPYQAPGNAANDFGLAYRAHVQDLGWCEPVHDGQTAGTVGFGKRMEAFKITPPEGITLDVIAHIQNVGDKAYRGIVRGQGSGTGSSSNDPIIGTVGKSLRVEGISISVEKNTNPALKGKVLKYRCHVENVGWTEWAKAGTYCGTRGKSLRVEAIQMKFE